MSETKSQIRARLDELEKILTAPHGQYTARMAQFRKAELEEMLESAEEDTMASVIRSHKAICRAKSMDEKAAYGNDPAMYYTMGICGEAGEMSNKIVKALRNGLDKEKILEAVKSELPDVIIYSYVLAYVLGIDLTKLVNEKVGIVVKRAIDGYYGGEIR